MARPQKPLGSTVLRGSTGLRGSTVLRVGRLVAAPALAATLAVSACGTTGKGATPASPKPGGPGTPSTPPAYSPSAPQPTPEAAAGLLVHFWAANDRAGAGTIAAPPAVASLLNGPFPGPSNAQSRGCSDTNTPPVTCTYGPTANANQNSALYQITVANSGKGWYVTAVQVES